MNNLTLKAYNSLFQSDTDFLREQIALKPTTRPREFISEYAEEKRVLPPNTPFPGPWRNSRTPYLVEIMNQMAPYSVAQHPRFMKCAQAGGTACAENIMAYYMDENPAPIMITSATEESIKDWMELRAEHVIDSCGFRHKIVLSTVTSSKSRKIGDKAMLKEFIGGFLTVASAQAAAKLRSKSIRILIRDEIDGAPEQLKSGEGNWLEVSEARTDAWGSRKKIFDFSTPATEHLSLINRLYLDGDRRIYLVPCPLCGKEQELEFGSEDTQHGLKPIRTAGILENVVYVCEKCHEPLQNFHKVEMLARGRWEITAEREDPINPSYHISGLYSPVGMVSWTELYKKYERAIETPDGMRAFVTLSLGRPYRETGERPKLSNVIQNRGDYNSGTVPEGVVYLVAGIDVQAGSKRDDQNPPRLEMEVMGIGKQYKTWSIAYKRFEGSISDPFEGAWAKLYEFEREGGLVYRGKNGLEFPVEIIFIDSGDGNYTSTVYTFVQGWKKAFPSKGASKDIRRKRGERADEVRDSTFKRYRWSKVSGDITLYNISTVFYKEHIYRDLRIERRQTGNQRPGFADFPADYPDSYFQMLTAEDHRTDGSFYCPSGRRNEALDCRVMCLCAADVYIDSQLELYRIYRKRHGATDDQVRDITLRPVIDMLAERVKIQIEKLGNKS
jgi:phage terminase large subunit GpA-like protein